MQFFCKLYFVLLVLVLLVVVVVSCVVGRGVSVTMDVLAVEITRSCVRCGRKGLSCSVVVCRGDVVDECERISLYCCKGLERSC